MSSGELQASNYNYDATVLQRRVRELFARDDQLLGDIVQRSVLARLPGLNVSHVATRIDVLPKAVGAGSPEVLDYGTVVFVKEALNREALLDRLLRLSEKRFQVGEQTLSFAGPGFCDRLEPSQNSYSEWPCRIFDVIVDHAQLASEPLLHPTLKSFSSTFDGIQEFLMLGNFNGSSDGRLGRIQVVIPNLNARIESLTLHDSSLQIRVGGTAPVGSLKIALTCKSEREITSIDERIDRRDPIFDLAFRPTKLTLWLISVDGFLADFHDENPHYSAGANAVLPKDAAPPYSDLPLLDPSETPVQKVAAKRRRRAVVLTALGLEYKAVRTHLSNLREETHHGTVYEHGEFSASDGSIWEAYIAEIGAGNSGAARETERVISRFDPEIAVLVGVAGGLKDVSIGDVVVATKVYGYEAGKAKREFYPRPQVHDTAYELQQRARAEARRDDWFKRVGNASRRKFQVFIAPIASGEKVLASRLAALSKFLRANYGDALAIEMEGWGFLEAVHANHDVRGLIVRGISDLVDGKSKADAAGSQVRAVRHASAFVFEVLSKLTARISGPTGSAAPSIPRALGVSEQYAPDSTTPLAPQSKFQRDPQIDRLIDGVILGSYETTVRPAIEIVRATDADGHNELFLKLLDYQDCEDPEVLSKAMPTIEACVQFAPQLIDHSKLSRMAGNADFSVRSSAASICMDLAQFAPDRVPVDLLIKLSVYSEDWYVETPANAALKAMARSMPAVLRIFFARLQSQDAEERVHAARALREIAKREPEILDPDELKTELSRLRALGDKKASAAIAEVLPRVQRSPRIKGYKYGL